MNNLEKYKKCQGKEHGIIVGGDFSKTINEENSGLLGLAGTTGLVYQWISRYPNASTFSTCQKVKTRIDSVLMSRKLIRAVKK